MRRRVAIVLGIEDQPGQNTGSHPSSPLPMTLVVGGQQSLYLLPNLRSDDRLLLARVRFSPVGDSARVYLVVQQLVESTPRVSVAPEYSPMGRSVHLRPQLLPVQVLLQCCHRSQAEVLGEDLSNQSRLLRVDDQLPIPDVIA